MSRPHQDIPAAAEQLKTLRQTFTAHLVLTDFPGGTPEEATCRAAANCLLLPPLTLSPRLTIWSRTTGRARGGVASSRCCCRYSGMHMCWHTSSWMTSMLLKAACACVRYDSVIRDREGNQCVQRSARTHTNTLSECKCKAHVNKNGNRCQKKRRRRTCWINALH